MFASPTDPPCNNSNRNCDEFWKDGFTQLNRVVQPLAIINFNVLDLLKGYTALDIADREVTCGNFGS
jgi:hypothetical protein